MMEMKNISDFLKKFKIIPDPAKDKEKTAQLIFEKTGIKINPSEIQIKKDILFLSCHSAIKTALYMKKTLLLEGFSKELPHLKIEDIR